MLSKKIVKYIQSLSHKKLRDEEGHLLQKAQNSCRIFISQKILFVKYYVLIKDGFQKIKIFRKYFYLKIFMKLMKLHCKKYLF